MPEGRDPTLMFEHHVFTLILHYVVPVLSPDRTKYWRLLCCGLVCQLLAHWLVSAQPLFPSVNSPLDHSALLLPPMPHIWLNANIWAGCLLAITMTHTSFTSNKSAQEVCVCVCDTVTNRMVYTVEQVIWDVPSLSWVTGKWGECADLIWAVPTGLFREKSLAVSGEVRRWMFVYESWAGECWDAFSLRTLHNASTTSERCDKRCEVQLLLLQLHCHHSVLKFNQISLALIIHAEWRKHHFKDESLMVRAYLVYWAWH